MPKKNQQTDELEAFCHSCPALEEVIAFLEQMGMRLDFQMDAFLPPAYSDLAQLPAQFHFEDASGMSIIYLAGEDRAQEDGERLPPHKSRFWGFPGADAHIFGWITQSVAHRCVSRKPARMSPRKRERRAENRREGVLVVCSRLPRM
jgi:hypothetical protein